MNRRLVTARLITGRLVAALLAAASAGWILAAPSTAQPILPAQQLQGTFHMSGTVTVAVNIPGEWPGQPVTRTWTFTPLCSTAPCAKVELLRRRATGTDTVMLHAIGPRAYTGVGRFNAPLRCTGRLYRPGEIVPFTIRVTVTATTRADTGIAASAIRATYVNTSRLNLTPCIGVFGHDAARYTGQLPPA